MPALLWAIGCSGSSTRPVASYSVDTLPSGLVQISNSGTVSPNATGAWRIEEELRLGNVDAGGPEQFSDVWDLAADTDGNLYVLDGLAQEVRVFTSSGEFSHTIGKKGEGPGEFVGAAGLDLDPDGRLWVWDPTGYRYSVFERNGEFLTSHRREVRGVVYPWLGGFATGGDYVDWGLDRPGDVPSQGIIGRTSILHPIRFRPPARFDTLPPVTFSYDMASNGQPKPLASGLTLAMSRRGHVLLANTGEYRILVRALDGDTLLAFSRPGRAAQVTDGERDSIVAAFGAMSPRMAIEPTDVPTHKPVLRRIFADGSDYVYVVVQEDGVQEGTVIDAFRSDGVFVDRLVLPRQIEFRSPPPFATHTHLHVVEYDSFDVPYVVRYRIVRPEAP
jgi:hypothetical protein